MGWERFVTRLVVYFSSKVGVFQWVYSLHYLRYYPVFYLSPIWTGIKTDLQSTMTYEERKKRMTKLAKQARFSRENLLFMIDSLEDKMPIEGYSTVLDWKESLGFRRYEGEN